MANWIRACGISSAGLRRHQAELDWVRLLGSAYLALGSALSGRLAACEQRAHATLELAGRRGWTRTIPAGVALTALAACSSTGTCSRRPTSPWIAPLPR